MTDSAATKIQNLGVNILNQSISQRFQEQVIRYGDRVAIQYQDRTITYNELNGWANQIARAIVKKRGMGAEPIALLFETGPEAIAAILGVLKAGKFYVPLDMSWPGYRLNSILEDSQAEIILSNGYQFLATGLYHPDWESVVSNLDVLWLDNLDGGISQDNLEIQSHPDDLAYIIYTSGSSGQPKGVMQNHRYVLNLYKNYTNSGLMTEQDRFSLLYSAAFAGAVRDIYCALLNGAALLPLDMKRMSLHQLGGWLRDNEITVMFAVATLFRHFAATLKGEDHFPKLRLIQIGSETVYRQDAELFQKHFDSGCTLIANLGGTEISPVRQFPITKNTVLTGGTVPAGYEVEGTKVFLWNESGEEVPPGEVGEIVVSSQQVALGYWRQPELTELVFVSDSERHYYKTGDLGRLLPDGCLLHLGRKDFQIKIRGYRVETSEVEGALLSLESVREAVVTAQADVDGGVSDRFLVAYLTAVDSENKPTAKELKEAMAARLPDYAIPAYFVWLESLPLTATGKIDRRSLPKPEILLISELDIVPARNATEEKLVQIWSEVLKLPAVGVENNFFDLGGNSLHASRVLVHVSEKFNRELSLKTIFTAPTIAEFAKHLESGKTERSLPPLVPQPVSPGTKIPLSFPQQGLWFVDSQETNKAVYNLFRGFHLTGKIDVGCLEKAITAIIERHDILRTSFEIVDGELAQAIAPSLPFSLDISDLQDLPATERMAKIEEITREVQSWIFDLARPPLLKVVLIRLRDKDYQFLLAMHHIISDDWSIQVFLKELSVFYKAFNENSAYTSSHTSHTPQPSDTLPRLPIQYADYAHWQHQYLAGEVGAEQLDYWKRQLADAPLLLDLPTDFPRNNSDTSFQSGIVSLKIDCKTTKKLKALSRRGQTTLFVTILTAFAVLLYRYSNQEDIVIGTGVANRNPAITEKLIGLFVNILALRVQMPDNPSFLTLLERVQQTALDAHAYANIPFLHLAEKLQIKSIKNYKPVFQVLFVLQNVTQETLTFPDMETERLDFAKPTAGATFDLTLSLRENNEGLVGTLEYDTNLFAATTIEQMADHFLRLVGGIAENPEIAIADVPLLSTQEREQLLFDWNKTETDYPRQSCIHQLFETQVENTPDVVALVFGEETLTYSELNEQANQLAHYLQTAGVGVESLVGVCLERSPKFIISILAILKAGGAYLPLDPTYPSERLTFMVEDAGIQVIVIETSLSDNIPQLEHSVNLNTQGKTIATYPKENINAPTRATSLAYVMYTSGSTGKPKGVCVTHRNTVRLVKNTNYASFKPDDVFLQLASISFDAATLEIWGSLLNGARLVIYPERQPSLTALGVILRQHQVTILWLTAGLFHLMVDEGLENLQSLRLLMAGGDVLSVTHVEKYCREFPSCQLINGYGPTENTTFTCCYPIDGSTLGSGTIGKSIPIGRPIANTRAYILDSQKQLVPIGLVGELYTGGDGVARGYLNRPELNAERFIPSPFVEGDRLYKTGDQVRYLADGRIEFLGRVDHQVKIRGFRIELREIEAVLSQHPDVKQALAIVHKNSLGDKSLVVYTTGRENGEVKEFLQQKLPDYMQPNTIVWLEEFPLTANGKVDRRALPIPDMEAERKTEFVVPRTPTETVIAKIITEVLGVERVGINDNFLALGGHSLLAIKVIDRLREKLGVDLLVRSLFESPTVAELAEIIAKSEQTTKTDIIPVVSDFSATVGQPLSLSFAQSRLWFLNRLETAPNATYNVSIALEISGVMDIAALERSLEEIIRRHAILRSRIEIVNGIPHQVIFPAKKFQLNPQAIENRPLERQRFLQERATAEAETPFDLEKDEPMRVSLWQWSRENYAFFLTLHHIVSDGWSVELLFQELSTLYAAFANGKDSPLPELPIQYHDYAVWQRQRLKKTIIETELNYWKHQLTGISSPISLPTDRPRPPVQTFRGERVYFQLDGKLSQQLQTLAHANNSTLFITLLATFVVLLSRYSSQDDIPIGTPVSNRNRQTESLIGFFVNTMVLRTPIEGNASFQDLLGRLRQIALDAYSHQDIPFEKVVEALQPERSPSYTPLFQVMFTLEKAPTYGNFPGLTIAPIEWENKTAKFDLTLSIVEEEEGLSGNWEYNRDLFDSETIARMNLCWQTLLAGIVSNPEMSVEQLPLAPPDERERLLVEWNKTEQNYPEGSVLELFAEQVRRQPEAIALQYQNRIVTYGELDEQSNRLAGYLQSLGVGAETIVGICLERTPEMFIALWATLKAGGAYVPLDPAAPPERIAYILEDTQLSILLSYSHLVANFSHPKIFVIDMDIDWQSFVPPPFVLVDILGDRLAYIIYTSGSTGKPKGVEICHRSLANLVMGAITNYQITDSDRWLQFYSFSFDGAVEDIYPCLLSGGTLVLRTNEMLASSEQFWQQCREWQITVLNIPTAYWHFLAANLTRETRLSVFLRLVVIAGEAALPGSLARWQKYMAEISDSPQLINAYGPTEATVTTTLYFVTNVDSEALMLPTIPIGKPIGNTKVYVLDPLMQPVPIGVPGELYIGGAGLARGYLHRQELTTEKFVFNPFGEGRLYKTGDLVRYRPDGNLEFIGRFDYQVKLRGFRIELGEIEAVLSQHPQVKQAIVTVREDSPGDKFLVAYAMAAKEGVSNAELRNFMQQKLPHYMLPSIFIILDELPLTVTGKVDRRALPAPERERLASNVEFVAPRTPTEVKLVAIWAEVLERQQVSIHDNFFELGGHSLLATQLMFRIREAFEIDISLLALFDYPSISALAGAINQVLATGYYQSQGLNLEAEAVLAPDIQPSTAMVPTVSHLGQIFLTGATGFLGSQLLYELLTTTNATISCLVRANNLDAGWERLKDKLQTSGLWSEDFSSRIIPIVGDLGISSFGLSASQYNNLSQEIDVIYHLGVKVHHLLSYALLKNANVLGTEEVLRMASLAKIKPVHYVSTISVFSTSQSDQPILESATVDPRHLLKSGYVETKWVGEQLVWEAAKRGLPVKVYRPSRIGGSSKTGISNFDDLLSRFIKGCIQLKHFPTWEGFEENLIPVDYASKAIVYLSQKEDCFGKAFHLINPESVPLRDIFNSVQSLGYDLEEINYNDWRSELIEAPDNPLYPYLAKFPESLSGTKEKIEYDRGNVVEGLKGSGIESPEVNRDLLKTYLSYFEASGFLWN